MRQKASGLERTVAADASGVFRFENVAVGGYQVSARSAGFSVATRELTASAGDVLSLYYIDYMDEL